jgi:hypothetical protein
MRIADSLRIVVKKEIDSNYDKKIDRVLCNKRKSLSFGGNIDSFGMHISQAFEKAGRIGLVLRDIFFNLLCDNLNLNESLRVNTMLRMPIYASSPLLKFL